MRFSRRRGDSGRDDSRDDPGRDDPALENPAPENSPRENGDIRLSARVFGVVQGVGFRFWTMGKADELALKGVVRNLDDGRCPSRPKGPSLRSKSSWTG